MSLTTPQEVLNNVTHESLSHYRENPYRNPVTELPSHLLTDEVLDDLAAAAEKAGEKSYARMVSVIKLGNQGDFSKAVPRFHAAAALITSYLLQDIIDGWVYRREADGHLHAYLVASVTTIDKPREKDPHLVISLVANNGGGREGLGSGRSSVTLRPEDVTRKRVADILLGAKLFKETAELRAEYDATTERYRKVLTTGFSEQYRFTGIAGSSYRTTRRENHKVIHDISIPEIPSFAEFADSVLFRARPDMPAKSYKSTSRIYKEGDDDLEGVGAVPINPLLRVFDLSEQDFIWVNTEDLTLYAYKPELRDKLILPDDQRELLDILTTDLTTFTADSIEGKSAGNVILAKGKPGLGKTLTAEIYSEIIQRPLYSIHSGSLGVTAVEIQKNLKAIFERSARWNAIVLLDEADVFVIERGSNIQQNAIVAEFLRTLEYFTQLMFMTTNRADQIDDAILSRCAAIIDYQAPGQHHAREIWNVLAANNEVTLDSKLVDGLLVAFPEIAPRDMKHLLRLALRVSAARGEELSVDLFGRCAMFRGLHRADLNKTDAA